MLRINITGRVGVVAARCRDLLASRDSSHSFEHIARVLANARRIAQDIVLEDADREIVDLAALVHDVDDYKYKANEANQVTAAQILQDAGIEEASVQDVMYIVDNMSFSTELKGVASSPPDERRQLLLGIVQDADRLDAIGAIGIARCLSYGGAKKRVLYDPAIPPRTELTAEAYMATSAGPTGNTGTAAGAGASTGQAAAQEQSTTINHFYEKLLKLSGMMKTEPGRKLAQGRHEFMVTWLEQFHAEVAGLR